MSISEICSYFQAYEAQRVARTYTLALIYDNVEGQEPFRMADDGKYGVQVRLPVLMVSRECAEMISKYALQPKCVFFVHEFLHL